MAAAVAAFTVTILALVAGALAWAHPDNQLGPLDTRPTGEAAGNPAVDEKALERPHCPVSNDLVPACGRWWGVAPAALTGQPRRASLLEFENKIGRPVDIYHGYHRDDEVFPTDEEVALAREPGRERLLFLNWKPSTTSSWASIADGAVDDRIDRLAEHIRTTFPEPFFLTVWHEPENDVDPGKYWFGDDGCGLRADVSVRRATASAGWGRQRRHRHDVHGQPAVGCRSLVPRAVPRG